MQRVVSFYERLPRGPAPEHKPSGLLQRYQHRYFNGKNPSAMRTTTPICISMFWTRADLEQPSPGSRHWHHDHPWLRPELLLPLAYVSSGLVVSRTRS
ncbi:unnamed protein product [Aureobasidium uvarum]|uniref:Uncharacterized protein n=1 Tax=Aureobasidium uvarum TaxID=2773716 RepID=A0A9N8PS85_9PEZI|nr:unnamed protein product [Aureobasidium uvarum]